MGIQRGLLLPYNRFNKEEVMIRLKKEGFTLVELIITMSIFVIGIMLVSNLFINQLNLSRQQSAIVETNVEGIIGLEILRRDIENAGYGLPWVIPTGITYTASETFNATPCGTGTTANPQTFNDNPPNAPRAIVSGNNTCFNNSDYLVIKAINVATNNTSKKWALLKNTGVLRSDISGDAFKNSDRVIVLDPGTSETTMRTLVVSGSTFFKQYNAVTNFAPQDSTTTRIIYGIRDGADPKVPFNRAGYYINASHVPLRCASGTGVLYKATMNHGSISGTNQFTELPLLDCVADMQVIFGIDNDGDGDFEPGVVDSRDGYTDDISTQDAKWIRERVKEVRVYILAQEGQMDRNYSYPHNEITVGEFGLGRIVSIRPDWKHYRWKVYTLIVKPNNLR
jgi:prepilin-type N-terminal cleavage/methylation domain-containing protein